MSFAIAGGADLGLAARADAVFAAGVCAASVVDFDVFGGDPGTATFGGAVYTVFGGVFLEFLVPFCFESQVK